MIGLRRIIAGLIALFRKGREEQDLDEELHAYIESSTEEKIRAGMRREDARRTVRLEMGSIEGVKDQTRSAGWESAIDNTWRDVRYAIRMLLKSPVFSLVAVLTLALGIGANTAIFSLVDAVMLRSLPVERPEELISLSAIEPDDVEVVFSYSAYRHFALAGANVADALAASFIRRDAITIDGPPEHVDLKSVSGNYFTTLGIPAAIGRILQPSDDRLPGGENVAVLSDAYWARRFGRNPSVVGRGFRLKAAAFTIIGVAPRGFFGESVGEAPDVWIPLTSQPDAPSYLWTGHSTTWLRILARRQPGITLAHARAGLEPVYARIRDEMAGGATNPKYRKSILESRLGVSDGSAGSPVLRDSLSAPLTILMGLAGLVLIIACANVANLMLARAAPLRLIRCWLAESLLLATVGGAGGLLLAFWGTSVLATLVSGALPISLDLSPDGRVLAFTIVVSCATALLFGLVPALRGTRIDPLPWLKVSGGPGAVRARLPLGRALVIVQIAVSLVLLVAAGLFIRSLVMLKGVDTGFDAERVLLFQVAPVGQAKVGAKERQSMYLQLLTRAAAFPGVRGASGSFMPLFSSGAWGNAIAVEGSAPVAGVTLRTFANSIAPRYFDVMGIAVLRGRGFTQNDLETGPKVAVVNETFARKFLGAADPVGRRVALCTSDPCRVSPKDMMEIVGVTRDAKYLNLREEKRPMLYVPFTQYNQSLREIEVRTAGDPTAVAGALYRELAAADSRLAIVGMRQLRDQVDASIMAERLVAKLSTTFGILALSLAAVGLYGLIAYVTAQRTAEIGIRMALGADRRQVRWLILRGTLKLVAIGLVIGMPVAFAGPSVPIMMRHLPPRKLK